MVICYNWMFFWCPIANSIYLVLIQYSLSTFHFFNFNSVFFFNFDFEIFWWYESPTFLLVCGMCQIIIRAFIPFDSVASVLRHAGFGNSFSFHYKLITKFNLWTASFNEKFGANSLKLMQWKSWNSCHKSFLFLFCVSDNTIFGKRMNLILYLWWTWRFSLRAAAGIFHAFHKLKREFTSISIGHGLAGVDSFIELFILAFIFGKICLDRISIDFSVLNLYTNRYDVAIFFVSFVLT